MLLTLTSVQEQLWQMLKWVVKKWLSKMCSSSGRKEALTPHCAFCFLFSWADLCCTQLWPVGIRQVKFLFFVLWVPCELMPFSWEGHKWNELWAAQTEAVVWVCPVQPSFLFLPSLWVSQGSWSVLGHRSYQLVLPALWGKVCLGALSCSCFVSSCPQACWETLLYQLI